MNRSLPRVVRSRGKRRILSKFILAMAFAGLGVLPAAAGTFVFTGTSSDGHAVSGTADFTFDATADTVTVQLVNTTNLTKDAGELFTGLDFSLGGLVPTLTSGLGLERTVDGSGAFTDTGGAQNLSWSLVSLGGSDYQLNFNPDAKDAILGAPSGGDYSGANGSIKGNPGHNPFAAQLATFVLSVPGLEDTTAVNVTAFRYGTELQLAPGTIDPPPGGGIPEPSTVMLLVLAAGGCLWRRQAR